MKTSAAQSSPLERLVIPTPLNFRTHPAGRIRAAGSGWNNTRIDTTTMPTQYTATTHHSAKRWDGKSPKPVTLRRVPGTKPVEIKRAARAAKKLAAQ